jgi:hypothetical protein
VVEEKHREAEKLSGREVQWRQLIGPFGGSEIASRIVGYW